eukprot:4322-Prymnesium_polylepis.2
MAVAPQPNPSTSSHSLRSSPVEASAMMVPKASANSRPAINRFCVGRWQGRSACASTASCSKPQLAHRHPLVRRSARVRPQPLSSCKNYWAACACPGRCGSLTLRTAWAPGRGSFPLGCGP